MNVEQQHNTLPLGYVENHAETTAHLQLFKIIFQTTFIINKVKR